MFSFFVFITANAQDKKDPELETSIYTPQTIKEIYTAIGLTKSDISEYGKLVESPTIKYRQSSEYRDNPAAVLAIFESNAVERQRYYKAAAMYEQLMQKLEADLFQQTIAAAGLTKTKNIPVSKGYLVPDECKESCLEKLRLSVNYSAIKNVRIYFPNKKETDRHALAAAANIPVELVANDKIQLIKYAPSKVVKADVWFNE